jgi:hypothetical protein
MTKTSMTKITNRYFVAYYKKADSEIDPYYLPAEITKEQFAKDYVYLMAVSAETLEEVYRYMQGEVWSPHGEARDLVLALRVFHTSMMIGDVIFDPKLKQYWIVDRVGFKPIYLTNS